MALLPNPVHDRRWLRVACIAAIVALAAWLRLWHLDANGFGRMYYAAAVRSMSGSLHAFLFNAFDPAAFVSVDKPPVSLWMQVLAVKLLGFSARNLLLTQVLEGLAAIFLVYRMVWQHFGARAGLASALFLAVTPISVAVDRSNNTESCLTLVLLLACWALLRAFESNRLRWLLLASALVGVGFNVKMGAALLVVPGFVVAYGLATAGMPLGTRIARLAAAAFVLIVISLAWVTWFDLTPPGERPYAGSTSGNSMFELTVVHNGLQRLLPQRAGQTSSESSQGPETQVQLQIASARNWDNSPTGLFRLASPFHAAQVDWWLPLVLAGAVLGLLGLNTGPSGDAVDARKQDKSRRIQTVVWIGWGLTYGLTFSFAGGVFHTYYLAAIAPPFAALAGIGWDRLVGQTGDRGRHASFALMVLLLALWQAYVASGISSAVAWDWYWQSCVVVIALLMLVAFVAWRAPHRFRQPRSFPLVPFTGFAVSLVLPAIWAISVVLVRPNVAAPIADAAVLLHHKAREKDATSGREEARKRFRALTRFLHRHHGGERFVVAVPNAVQAAPLIVYTGASVMAMGGYLGRDPILTPETLEKMVKAGEVRFAMLGGASIVRPDTQGERRLADWIRANGRLVPAPLWGGTTADTARADAVPSARVPRQLYDLR